jgi:hypothetical protein
LRSSDNEAPKPIRADQDLRPVAGQSKQKRHINLLATELDHPLPVCTLERKLGRGDPVALPERRVFGQASPSLIAPHDESVPIRIGLEAYRRAPQDCLFPGDRHQLREPVSLKLQASGSIRNCENQSASQHGRYQERHHHLEQSEPALSEITPPGLRSREKPAAWTISG